MYQSNLRRASHGVQLIGAALLCVVVVASGAYAKPARPAPILPPPTGTVINVSTEAQLQAAVNAIASNVTIVLAPGTYHLTRSLYLNGGYGALSNIGIRGATGNADDVVIVGPGMANPSYGDAPFGIWTGYGVDGITIANLTIRDFYYHPIIFNGGTDRPHVYNVHLIDAGQQFLKSNPNDAGIGASEGIVEYSVFEFTTTARDGYPKAIDVHGGANWRIRNNLFRNLQAPAGQEIGPAVLVWRGSSNTITEGNTFLNCGRGILYGGEDAPALGHSGGIIRNNFFYRSADQYGDVGIQVADSPNTQVVNNTVLLSGTYRAAIEYRFPDATGLLIANNLTDAALWARDGAAATLMANVVDATPAMFVNAGAGDLHLQTSAATAIDQGITLPGVDDDWDGQLRGSTAADIGADEYIAPVVLLQIAGRVSSTSSGSALAGVTMTLNGLTSQTATTDATGAYVFQGLVASGNFTVTPLLQGYTFTPQVQYYYPLGENVSTADFYGAAVVATNQPPTVSLDLSASSIVLGGRVTLTAIATDQDNGIGSVSFYVNQKLIGTDASDPYSLAWKPSKAGTYAVVAVATDRSGATAPSSEVILTVTGKNRR
jgi:hypothetical protein